MSKAILILLAAALFLSGCGYSGVELTAPEMPEEEYEDIVVTSTEEIFVEARVAIPHQKVVAGSLTLESPADSVSCTALIDYQGEASGHADESVALGLVLDGQPEGETSWFTLVGTDCPVIKDSQYDTDPNNDTGYHERFFGTVRNVSAGSFDIPVWHGHAFSCHVSTDDAVPNDVGVLVIKLTIYRHIRVPVNP